MHAGLANCGYCSAWLLAGLRGAEQQQHTHRRRGRSAWSLGTRFEPTDHLVTYAVQQCTSRTMRHPRLTFPTFMLRID